MSDADYVNAITQAFNNGDERYWVHGYGCTQMRRIVELLKPAFPDASLYEYSNDPDACVFSVNIESDQPGLARIAKNRAKLIAQGRTVNLPI
ncbi:hypothetical protein [Agrobacterium rubi]|uniref:Uncharacterized protein n=1 Tax=Agrobacterium rubi TaxID=28099 RepID=A0AAE7UUD8_9HYPH|nr:hypothetical protein [Agrobacterium rubi]NTE90089.1 hypothetical protein [Agrobacterium rubi]NTF05944.1 hypothetical protein [Agrobacterium rubi]NTF39448.1 hypothetical protein [Agrobacterium rubi]OCJ51771.1 hypothetical protein A6U92_25560 [Agrobacterium rubi]QTG03910.1 hypothetical protein G6M88_26040 [Agrobacterium rubi]